MIDAEDRAEFEGLVRTRLHEIFSSRPWLVPGHLDQAAVSQASELLAAGATDVLAFGASRGVGSIDESIPLVSLNLEQSPSMMDNIRAAGAALAAPPAEAQAAIDAWDQQLRASATPVAAGSAERLAGRPVFGRRRPEWLALEDKLSIASVWAAAGLDISPSEVVELRSPSAGAAAVDAHRRLASERGTVWAADNTKGWHGGATGLRWAADEGAVDEILSELAVDHGRARVMPFLDGIPCSIHGLVVAGRTSVFRPCEMLTFRVGDEATPVLRFHYGRAGTFWDPAPADREAMRSAARRLGRELDRRLGYRGVFTLDGVMTADGFRPTEVNPRYGAALPSSIKTVDGPPINLYLVHLAIVDGRLDDLDADRLERWVVGNLDQHRSAQVLLTSDRWPASDRSGAIVEVDGHLDVVDHGDIGPEGAVMVATFDWGRGAGDLGFLGIRLSDEVTPVGPSVAPRALVLARAIDRAWNVGLPELEAAPRVR